MASNSGRMSVAVDAETQAKLDAIAKSVDRSRNWLVNEAIDQYLELYEWQSQKIQQRLNMAQSDQAQFLDSNAVDQHIDKFKA